MAEKATGSGSRICCLPTSARSTTHSSRSEPSGPRRPLQAASRGRRAPGTWATCSPGVTLADWVKVAEEAVVAIMVEKREAVEDLEAILDVPGIDMVQLSASRRLLDEHRPGGRLHAPGDHGGAEVHDRDLHRQGHGSRPRIEIGNWEPTRAVHGHGRASIFV